MTYVIFSSYGNDSIALIQHLHNLKCEDVHVVYSDTGWAASWWDERVTSIGEPLCHKYGFKTYRTQSEGMIPLVRRKSGWPMGGGGAYCTAELKVLPALAWLDEHDPEKQATCVTGVRREESRNRRDAPEWITHSERHGGRELWQPLVRHDEASRNALLSQACIDPLPHRSKECFPCVHANKADMLLLQHDEERVALIDSIERELGFSKNNKPKVMFRPKRHRGAVGIREVIRWANTDSFEEFTSKCDSGWCE